MSPGPPLERGARVLVRLPAWLGDFVMSEPLVRALDAWLEAGTLTLAGRPAHLALLEGRFPRARRLALEPLERGAARAWSGHDVALLCTGSFRSAWSALRAGIPRRVGFARDCRGFLLTDAMTPARERGATPLGLGRAGGGRRYLPRPLERSLAELAGLLCVPVRDTRPWIELREAWRAAARERRARLGLRASAPYVLASVGSRPGSAKGFPPARWIELLGELARREGLPVLLAGGPGEERSVAAVRAGLSGAHALLDPPAALPELAALCAEARVVLSADAGPRHLARAVGVAVACVAGPTDPRHSAGARGREALLRVPVPCGPCHRERCPLSGADEHRCMSSIETGRILDAARELLAHDRSATIRG
jgi:heptosyltransferase-2